MESPSYEFAEKEQRWREIEQEVEYIVDRLQKGIDEGIKSTVVALRANGFATTASCEGHTERANPWPWVDVKSALAEQRLRNLDPHYNELKDKERATRKGNATMTLSEKMEYVTMLKAEAQENAKEYRRLLNLLDEYYRSNRDENTERIRLVVKRRAMNSGRIQPNDVPQQTSGVEVQNLWSEQEKQHRLKLYREEMERFAAFLKQKYFSE